MKVSGLLVMQILMLSRNCNYTESLKLHPTKNGEHLIYTRV